MPKLLPGTSAPGLSLPLVGGGSFTLAERAPANFTMVVFYRGYHCPVCRSYLGKLAALAGDYAKSGVELVAVSMNDAATAERTKQEWGLANIALAFGMEETTARAWDLYISNAIREGELPVFNEPGLFLIRPDNTLYMASVGSMPFGRPDLAEMLDRIRFILERSYPPRGDRIAA